MNFACLLKLSFFSRKCWHANMVLGWRVFTLSLWLCSRKLKASVSVLHIVFLHKIHSIKSMTYAQKWITLWKSLCVFWVCWLLKVDVVVTWLQYRVLLFPKDGNLSLVPCKRVLIDVSFLLPFISYTPVQELVAWARCIDIQSLLMLYRVVWFLILDYVKYCLNDFGCSQSIWWKLCRSFYLLCILV